MSIATLFKIAKIWKQFKCSSGEWLNKLIHPYCGILSVAKKNKLLIHTKTWKDLKRIRLRVFFFLSSLSQSQICMIPFAEHSQSDRIIEVENRLGIGRGGGQMEDSCDYNGVAQGVSVAMEQFCILIVVLT